MRCSATFLIVLTVAALAPCLSVHAETTSRQKCERLRDDNRASCLQAITDEVRKCQRACLSDANQTTCERQCQLRDLGPHPPEQARPLPSRRHAAHGELRDASRSPARRATPPATARSSTSWPSRVTNCGSRSPRCDVGPGAPGVALLGPTASGKSAVAMAAARRLLDVELVCIDAMQVYRGMDIGTAKPTPAEQTEIRHHLIDIVDPGAGPAVADFRIAARDAARRHRRTRQAGPARRRHRPLSPGRDRRHRAPGAVARRPGRARAGCRTPRGTRPPRPTCRSRSGRRGADRADEHLPRRCGRSRCASGAGGRSVRSDRGSTSTRRARSSSSACGGRAWSSPSGSSGVCRR